MGSESKTESILVTGGAGFIGTHTVLQLLNGGFHVSIIDNLDNSVEVAVDRVRELAGPDLSRNLKFHIGDLRNKDDLEKLFSQTRFDAVVHFAGLKAVGESVAKPFRYFDNNLIGTLNLYEIMAKYGCKKMVFSSSATVYGQPEKIPCVEHVPKKVMGSVRAGLNESTAPHRRSTHASVGCAGANGRSSRGSLTWKGQFRIPPKINRLLHCPPSIRRIVLKKRYPIPSTPLGLSLSLPPFLSLPLAGAFTPLSTDPFSLLRETLTLDFAMKGGKSKADTSKKADAKLSVKRKAAEKPAKKPAPAKKSKAVKDPNKPKRPPSAFFVFMEDFRKQFKEKNPNNKQVSVVGKAAGDKWKTMSAAEKAPFEARAAKRKADYNKVMVAYNKKQSEGGGKKSAEEEDDEEESDKSKSEVHDDEDDDESGDDEDEDDDE